MLSYLLSPGVAKLANKGSIAKDDVSRRARLGVVKHYEMFLVPLIKHILPLGTNPWTHLTSRIERTQFRDIVNK